MLAAETNVKIVLGAGNLVISAGYCYFLFYDTFYKVLKLKLHLNFKNAFFTNLYSQCNNRI